MRFALGPGQQNDMAPACDLIRGLHGDKVLADRAYDADSLHDIILEQGTLAIEWMRDGHVMMTGGIALAFKGVLDSSLLA